jgi:folate-binding protein YgfZ
MTEYQAARQGAALFDLSSRGKVEVTGADAEAFLHRLCTNDLRGMPVGAGCEAFFSNATARALFHVRIYHVLLHNGQDAFWIDTDPGQNEALLRHLDRYAISDAVEFADRTAEFRMMHLAGPSAKSVLEKALMDEVPELESLQHMVRTFGTSAHAHVRRNDLLALPGYDILCLQPLAETVRGLLERAGATPAGPETFEQLRVEAGLPAHGHETDDNRFIVELGRIPQTISYAKGCFPGQEPVVMARDRGAVQRTLLGVKLSGSQPAPEGTKLVKDGKEVGATTSSVVSPTLGTPVALAYVRRGFQTPGTVLEVEIGGEKQTGEVTPLPIPGTR